MRIPKDLIETIRELTSKGSDLQEAIEDESYTWVENHPNTLWTGLELVEILKEQQAELFSPFLSH